MRRFIEQLWYRKNVLTYVLAPFSWLFQFLSYLRRCYYCSKRHSQFNVPIIIVGNLSVGGTGKTPLVSFLANFFNSRGYHPGIVMHSYGSDLTSQQIRLVTSASNATIVGDEALLLARKCQCPMVAGRNRVKAVKILLEQFPHINIVICDDGLQHYALERSLEIAVIDGQRRFGNGFCLPAGPLRESPRRLKSVDFVVTNGEALQNEWAMSTALGSTLSQVIDPHQTCSLDNFVGKVAHAVAGIGHPERFFTMLQNKGITIIKHYFADHYRFTAQDFQFDDEYPILMTEKDAVKCEEIAPLKAWSVPLEVSLTKEFSDMLLRKIESGQKVARHSCLPHLQATPPIQERR